MSFDLLNSVHSCFRSARPNNAEPTGPEPTDIHTYWYGIGGQGGHVEKHNAYLTVTAPNRGPVFYTDILNECHVIVIAYCSKGVMFARFPEYECHRCISLSAARILDIMGCDARQIFPNAAEENVRLYVFVPERVPSQDFNDRKNAWNLSQLAKDRLKNYKDAFSQNSGHPWHIEVYLHYPFGIVSRITLKQSNSITIQDAGTIGRVPDVIKSPWETEVQANGDQANGDQANGDQANGDQANGDQANGDQASGDQASGDQASGDQANGDHANGGQENGGANP